MGSCLLTHSTNVFADLPGTRVTRFHYHFGIFEFMRVEYIGSATVHTTAQHTTPHHTTPLPSSTHVTACRISPHLQPADADNDEEVVKEVDAAQVDGEEAEALHEEQSQL